MGQGLDRASELRTQIAYARGIIFDEVLLVYLDDADPARLRAYHAKLKLLQAELAGLVVQGAGGFDAPQVVVYATDAIFPPVLDTVDFRRVWAEWVIARRRKSAYPEKSQKKHLERLAKSGLKIATITVQFSLDNEYTGLFPEKFTPKDPGRREGESAGAADRRQAAEKRAAQERVDAKQRHEEQIAGQIAALRALPEITLAALKMAVVEEQPEGPARAAAMKADILGGGRLTTLAHAKLTNAKSMEAA